MAKSKFERYVNFEFYKTVISLKLWCCVFERYVNFEFYKTGVSKMTEQESLRDM